MPLLDHFHPPLTLRRHWNAFHHAWATYISSALNRQLPEGYFAEPNIQFGIEIDVAAFEEGNGRLHGSDSGWTPPVPAMTVPFTMITDLVEVKVFSSEEGPTLAGAIELVSPANKDRRANRDAFVSKCAAYLQQGVGLVIVDVVTDRHANLHQELLERLAASQEPVATPLFAVAYRPVLLGEEPNLAIWPYTLELGQSLPTLPLCLPGELYLQVDLEATYQRTCEEQRVSVP